MMRAGAPRTWLVRHPDPQADARVWVVDERAQDWHAIPTWSDLAGVAHGSPGKPWPREVYDWVLAGVAPLVIPMSSMDYVVQPSWWKGLVWNDVRQAWLLGWEPLNSQHVDALWGRTSLENRLLALEKTPALRPRLGMGPARERYEAVLQATIDSVRADPHQPALLVGVLEAFAEEWREPPPPPSDDPVEDEAPEPLTAPLPSRDVDADGNPRVRFSIKKGKARDEAPTVETTHDATRPPAINPFIESAPSDRRTGEG